MMNIFFTNKTWKVVINGWTPLKFIVEDKIEYMKPKKYQTSVEDENALGNSHALNVIQNGVNKNIYRIINTCNITKDTRETLEVSN